MIQTKASAGGARPAPRRARTDPEGEERRCGGRARRRGARVGRRSAASIAATSSSCVRAMSATSSGGDRGHEAAIRNTCSTIVLLRVPGARSYQQGRILGLPTRAGLCEIPLQNEVPASAKSKTQIVLKPNTSIEYPRPSQCPACNSKLIYRHGKRSTTLIDLKFMRYGVKRWIARYVTQRYRCRSCLRTFYSPGWRWTGKYGPDLIAYTIYQNIELRIPQSLIAVGINQLFGLNISRNTTNKFKSAAAQIYKHTYDKLLKGLCKGRLLHIDETSISIKEGNGYVWVLTSMEEVAYFYTPTREGSTIQSMLKNFSGHSGDGLLCGLRRHRVPPTEMPDPSYPRPERRIAETSV